MSIETVIAAYTADDYDRGQKIIPAVAYAELYVYYIGVKEKEQSTLDHLLRKLDTQFARMEKVNCAHGGIIGINCGEYGTHWRDYLIAAHPFNAPYIVDTENIRDSPFLEGRVMTVGDAMRDLHCIVRLPASFGPYNQLWIVMMIAWFRSRENF